MRHTKITTIISFALLVTSNVSGQQTNVNRMDGITEKRIYKEKEIIPYDYVREADVIWEKRIWRVIDVREKINKPFAFEKEPLISILLELLKNEKVQCFGDDEFKEIKLSADVLKIGGGDDTVPWMDPVTNEYVKDTIVHNDFDPSKVYRFRLKEEWFIDKETSTMQVRILGIAPLYFDVQANLDFPMCWFYYPDLRPEIIHHEIFNPKNDMMRLSWEDVFEMRLFSSYITMESNVYDRTISSYAPGLDGVLESERIKNVIFEKEHDLWSF